MTRVLNIKEFNDVIRSEKISGNDINVAFDNVPWSLYKWKFSTLDRSHTVDNSMLNRQYDSCSDIIRMWRYVFFTGVAPSPLPPVVKFVFFSICCICPVRIERSRTLEWLDRLRPEGLRRRSCAVISIKSINCLLRTNNICIIVF